MKALLLILIAILLLPATGCVGDHGVGYNASMDWIDRKTNDLLEWRREHRLRRLMRDQEVIEENWLNQYIHEAEGPR